MNYLLDKAIRILNPSVVTIRDDIAYDKDENEIAYDKNAAETKVTELEADAIAVEQAQITAKQSALNKLMALVLTEEEALALGIQ